MNLLTHLDKLYYKKRLNCAVRFLTSQIPVHYLGMWMRL